MGDFFARWQPWEFLVLAGIVAMMVVLIVGMGVRSGVRHAGIAAQAERERLQFKRDMLERGLPAEQVALVLGEESPDDGPGKDHIAAIAEGLAYKGVAPETIEEVIVLARAADAAARKSARDAVSRLAFEYDDEVEPEQIVAAVRGICRPAAPPEQAGQPPEAIPQFNL